MKRSLFILLVLNLLSIPAGGAQHDYLTVDGQYLMLEDTDAGTGCFIHDIGELDSGTAGGVLNIMYDGVNPEAASFISIGRLSGNGNLELQGTSTNTLQLFRLGESAAAGFRGNITLSNYCATWDGDGLYDSVVALESGDMALRGSIALDVAGYCAEDSFFSVALGLGGDWSIGGLDAPDFIATAAYVYSGSLVQDVSAIRHNHELGDYITPEAHTLTIDTDGTHHFHGSLLGPLTIIKKGSGTQSFTGNLDESCHYQALGGALNLNGDTRAAAITINGATLTNTGNLSTAALNMQSGSLTVAGTLNATAGDFRGRSTVNATAIHAGSWTLHLEGTHREKAALSLGSGTTGCIGAVTLAYNKADLLRGWYRLMENTADVTISTAISGNTRIDNGVLMYYLADGERTLPRAESARLVWNPTAGTWKTGTGHAEQSWAGPDINSNFLAGDSVSFAQAAEVGLVGELLPSAVTVSNATGSVSFTGSGSIGGVASLIKSGEGSLSISGAHTFTGGTTLEAGELIASHAGALGRGSVQLRGGRLNLSDQTVGNAIQVQGDAEITGGSQYCGELVMQGGTLRGAALNLSRTAQLHGGEIALELTGSGGVQVLGDVRLSSAGSYSGATTISSGTLTLGHAQALGSSPVVLDAGSIDLNHLNLSNSLRVQGDATLLNAGQYSGQIELQSGRLTSSTLGSGSLSCSGSATLQAEGTLHLASSIHNTGTLNMEGVFDVSTLAASINPTMVDAYGATGGSSGFQRDSGTSIRLFTGGGSLSGTATFLFRGEKIALDAQGEWSAGAATHYGQYHIDSGHQVAVSAIRDAAGEALQVITMSGGQLTADESATVAAEGGRILLTGGTLDGSCADTAITATGGTLGLSFSGNSSVTATAAVRLSGCISNTGTLTLQGELDATALPLQEQAATRVGGTSAASGFTRSAACSVQVVSGGHVNAGATIIHGEKRLTLGKDGLATAGGTVDYSEYLLTGTDTARLSDIRRTELLRIRVEGGTFTVDADTAALQTSGGTVVLESGTISCPISGSTALHITGAGRLTAANTHTGGTVLDGGELTITSPAALGAGSFRTAGTCTLTAEGFTLELSTPIQNDGHLFLKGRFDASDLAESRAATMVDAFGHEGGSSGFLRDAGTELQLITGGTLNCSGADILLHGRSITPDATGHASLPGALHRDTYRITDGHSVSVSDILQAADGELQRITMDSGTLLVDANTDALAASGGLVQVKNAMLGGTLSGTTRVELLGDAVLSGANSHSGGTTIATGNLRLAHALALGSGAVHLGSRARSSISAPRLDMGNLPVSNELIISGSSELAGLENFSGSITMQQGAEMTIAPNDVLNLSKGQTLTLAPDGNTIHGRVNMNGGTIVLTGGALTLNGVAHFSDTVTLDLSQVENLDSEILVLDFPSAFDEELISIVLPEDEQDKGLVFDPETGRLTVETGGGDTPELANPSLAPQLNRNQRAAYEVLRRLSPDAVSGELRGLVETVAESTDVEAMRSLMDHVNGAGYTALVNSVADDAFAQLQRLRDLAGTAHRLAPHRNTAVLIHAFNSTGSATAQEQGYDRNAWGGQLIVEQQVDARLCLGLALANGQTRITPAGDNEHTDTATHLSGYALYTDEEWRFLLAAGMGMHEFSLSRRLANGTDCEVEGAAGSSVNFCVEISREFALRSSSALCPYLALQSTTAKVDSFSESDSTTALLAGEQQATLTELSIGTRYRTTLAESLQLGLHAAITATFGDTRTGLDMRFAGAPEHSFRLTSDERDTLGTRIGLTLALPLSHAATLHTATNLHLQSNSHYLDTQFGIILHF